MCTKLSCNKGMKLSMQLVHLMMRGGVITDLTFCIHYNPFMSTFVYISTIQPSICCQIKDYYPKNKFILVASSQFISFQSYGHLYKLQILINTTAHVIN